MPFIMRKLTTWIKKILKEVISNWIREMKVIWREKTAEAMAEAVFSRADR